MMGQWLSIPFGEKLKTAGVSPRVLTSIYGGRARVLLLGALLSAASVSAEDSSAPNSAAVQLSSEKMAAAHAPNQDVASQDLVWGQQIQLNSKILGQKRAINIALPANYASAEHNYPVVVVVDGGVDEDFLHISSLLRYFGTYQQMPEAIVVGIPNVDRQHDLTTRSDNAADQADIPQHGGADDFHQFIADELLPYVEQQYRTDGRRLLVGQSLGGLFASKVLLSQNDLFTHYLIVSPSLWWNDQALVNGAMQALAPHKEQSTRPMVYLSVGHEHPVMRVTAAKLSGALRMNGWRDAQHRYDYLPDEDHATALHMSVYQGFRWFFQQQPTTSH